ncbi:MAG: hypothetical protein AB7E79_08585 [Rhodospirillaceae bacterium]
MSLNSQKVMMMGAAFAAAFAATSPASALESKSYVVGWFSHATNNTPEDCGPGGPNPTVQDQYIKDLKDLGMSGEEIEALIKERDSNEEGPNRMAEIIRTRGRIDGKPTNPYMYPSTVKDPEWKSLHGGLAYGFDLDGKGPNQPDSFTHVDTKQKGIDHKLYTALGCSRPFRGSLEGRPTYWDWLWGQLKDSQPAWIITITGEDLSKDGEVTVTFDRALEYLQSNVDGSPRADVTYRIDADPRSHNVMKGKIENGVVTASLTQGSTPDGLFRMFQNPLGMPEFRLHDAKFDFKIRRDGTADGFLGGYQPWADLYFAFASGGQSIEQCIVGDIPGLYYLLKKNADAKPDPKTGVNSAISAAYYIETVPAFAVPADKAKYDAVASNR